MAQESPSASPVSHATTCEGASKPSTILAETQTLTESRGESSDPDRGIAFCETQTFTKSTGEHADPDSASSLESTWERGNRHPLLFAFAVNASGESPTLFYDEQLEMVVTSDGIPIIDLEHAPETMTHTAVQKEVDDPDR